MSTCKKCDKELILLTSSVTEKWMKGYAEEFYTIPTYLNGEYCKNCRIFVWIHVEAPGIEQVEIHGEVENKRVIKEIKGKVIYWCDPMGDIKEEWKGYERKLKNEHNLILENKVKVMDIPPSRERPFDVLFFDYGGLLPGAGGLIRSNCTYIIEMAEDNSSRLFVMVSGCTKEAMKDAMEDLGKGNLSNIFMNIQGFADFYHKYC